MQAELEELNHFARSVEYRPLYTEAADGRAAKALVKRGLAEESDGKYRISFAGTELLGAPASAISAAATLKKLLRKVENRQVDIETKALLQEAQRVLKDLQKDL